MATDCIFLQKLELMARIGVLPHEKEAPQPIWLDLELGVDLRLAAQSGQLIDTIDYAQLVQDLSEVCLVTHTDLVETLAETLAIRCLADKRVSWVKLALGKPQALKPCLNVGVKIYREQAS